MTLDEVLAWAEIEEQDARDRSAVGRAVLGATLLELAQREASRALAELDAAEAAVGDALDRSIGARAAWVHATEILMEVSRRVARERDTAAVRRGLEAA